MTTAQPDTYLHGDLMMRMVVVLAMVIATNAAFAQNAPTPFEQALAQKLSREIDGGLQCSAATIATQQKLAEATARIKALEDKYEPKAQEPK